MLTMPSPWIIVVGLQAIMPLQMLGAVLALALTLVLALVLVRVMRDSPTDPQKTHDPDFGDLRQGAHGGWVGESEIEIDSCLVPVEVVGEGRMPNLAQRLEFVRAVNRLREGIPAIDSRLGVKLIEAQRGMESHLKVRPTKLYLSGLVSADAALWTLCHPTAGEYGFLVFAEELRGPMRGADLQRHLKNQ